MQACHRDKMRFNILDGKSSVVWPSSLHPGLESKCCERKGGLPSVVTHLNAKDAFLPSSLSFFFTLISLGSSISPTLFFILRSHYFFSSPCLLPLPPPQLSTYHPIFVLLCHLSPPPSHTAASRPLVLRRRQSESKNHLPSPLPDTENRLYHCM